MEYASIDASCPEQILAHTKDVKVFLLDAVNGSMGTHAYVASQFTHFDELCFKSTLQIEGEIPEDVLIFSIKTDARSRLVLNGIDSSVSDQIVSVNNGPEFTAICGHGHRSFDFGIPANLLADALSEEAFDDRLLQETHAYRLPPMLHGILVRQAALILAMRDDDTAVDETLSELTLTKLYALSNNEPVSANTRVRIINTITRYIGDHLYEQIPSEKLADVAHCRIRSLQYAFRTILGLSPKQYLNRYRLNQFRRELLTTNDTGHERVIKTLANRHGNNHAGHLSRMYRELFGRLPSDGCPCGLHDHDNVEPDAGAG